MPRPKMKEKIHIAIFLSIVGRTVGLSVRPLLIKRCCFLRSASPRIFPQNHKTWLQPRLFYSTTTVGRARILDFTEEDDASSIDYEEEYCSIFDDCEKNLNEGQRIARHLNYDNDKLASLARLAVAFSPAQQCLSLQDIESVEILSVNHDHIDISAVVCESDGCVTVFVPVSFPNDCGSSSSMEECVLDNIVALDTSAQDIIIQRQDEVEVDDLCSLDLQTTSANYPSWWVHPRCIDGLEGECNTIKKLLNERDFQDAIIALAKKATSDFIHVQGSPHILQAAVAAVGPAGLYIRARMKLGEILEMDDDSHYATNEITTLDIPYSFGGDSVTSAVDLRSAVLRTIASS